MGRVTRDATDGIRRTTRPTAGGVVRRVDELGRIVIPVEIRKRFEIAVRDLLEISVRGDEIVLSRPRDSCVFCGRTDKLDAFHGRHVCGDCRRGLAADVVSAR